MLQPGFIYGVCCAPTKYWPTFKWLSPLFTEAQKHSAQVESSTELVRPLCACWASHLYLYQVCRGLNDMLLSVYNELISLDTLMLTAVMLSCALNAQNSTFKSSFYQKHKCRGIHLAFPKYLSQHICYQNQPCDLVSVSFKHTHFNWKASSSHTHIIYTILMHRKYAVSWTTCFYTSVSSHTSS